jgi:hypothetical protein
MNKYLVVLLLGVGILLIAGLSITMLTRSNDADIINALRRDDELQITNFIVYNAIYTSNNVPLTNAESLIYLTAALRNATNGFESGQAFRARIGLSNGRRFDVPLIIAKEGRSVAVGEDQGVFKDEKFYGVKLESPMPQEVNSALKKMIIP